MEIKIRKNSQTPVYLQVANQIREQILAGKLRDGLLLPSERRLAERVGIHRNTVTRAYHHLKAEGYLESIQGKGYRVLPETGDADGPKHGMPRRPASGMPWAVLIRRELLDFQSAFDDLFSRSWSGKGISFAGGAVPPEAYDKDDIREILREIVESRTEDIFEYAHYQGQKKLRQNLSLMLRARGINVGPAEIQIVNETNHAIDYLAELFIEKGDAVITEEPVSPDIYRPLRFAGANILSVPLEPDGINPDTVERLIRRHRPKLIFISSSYQDPTAILLSLEKRRRLLEISAHYHVPVVEDDSASEIGFAEDPRISLKSLDSSGHVIYLYSFALTFAPGFRLACIAADRQVIRRLSYLQSMYMVSLDSINQSIMSKYIEAGRYDRNVRKICDLYRQKRDLMNSGLAEAEALGLSWRKPDGGVYLWCRLPEAMDAGRFVQSLYRKGLYVIPGNLYYPGGGQGENYIRLNYSRPSRQEIETGTSILTDTLRDGLRR